MHIDIAELVRESLRASGCQESYLNEFDGHSTIALEFDNCPNILISLNDEKVVIWSQLAEHSPNTIFQNAGSILELVMTPVEFSVTGQYQIKEMDGYTVLHCTCRDDCLSPEIFSDVLEKFYLNLFRYSEVIR